MNQEHIKYVEQVNIVDLIQKAEQDLQVQIDEKSLQIKLNIDDVCVKGKRIYWNRL